MIKTIEKIDGLNYKDLENEIKLRLFEYVKIINTFSFEKMKNYINSYLNSSLSFKEILLYIINNIVIVENKTCYLLGFKNSPISNTEISPENLFKLITYGNRDIKGTNILLKALYYAFNE